MTAEDNPLSWASKFTFNLPHCDVSWAVGTQMPFEEGERHRSWQIGTTCAQLVCLRKKLVRNQADKVRSSGKYFFWVREICSREKQKWENQRGGQWIKILEEKRQGLTYITSIYSDMLLLYLFKNDTMPCHSVKLTLLAVFMSPTQGLIQATYSEDCEP